MGSKLKRCLKYLASFLPSKLPTGVDEFNQFCDDIFETYKLPTHDSYRHAVATMVMHLPPTQHRASKRFFASSIIKAMANEVAYAKIQSIRDAEKAAKTEEPAKE